MGGVLLFARVGEVMGFSFISCLLLNIQLVMINIA